VQTVRNPVARHAGKFNKAVKMANKKRLEKSGHVKHKKGYQDGIKSFHHAAAAGL
jgi:hypothetical protein